MVDVDEFLRKASNWLRAEHLQVGDVLEILGAGAIDDETFDNPYLVLPVKLLRTGEEYNARLGAKNASRLADTFGTSRTEEWVGRKAEVVSIEYYRGLGTRGYVLRGLPKESSQAKTAETGLTEETLDVIRKSKEIIELGIPLNQEDFMRIPANVRAELLKSGLAEQRGEYYFFTDKAKKALS